MSSGHNENSDLLTSKEGFTNRSGPEGIVMLARALWYADDTGRTDGTGHAPGIIGAAELPVQVEDEAEVKIPVGFQKDLLLVRGERSKVFKNMMLAEVLKDFQEFLWCHFSPSVKGV